MRRLFVAPTSRSVLAVVECARWQSESSTPKGEGEEGAKTEGQKDAKSSQKKMPTEFEKLRKAIADNTKLADDMKREVLYTAANAENARREFRDSVATEKSKAEVAFAKELLESADALDNVCKAIGAYRAKNQDIPLNIASLLSGVDLSLKVVLKVLSRYGVSRMDIKVGDAFDEATMKSILTTPSTEEIKAGHVSNVVKAGYMRKENVLRAAEVGVAEYPEK